MSRFFQGGVSDSEYSSSEEELLSSSDEEEQLNSSDEEEQDADLSDDSQFANDDDDSDDSDSDDDFRAKGPAYFLKRTTKASKHDDSSDDEDDKKVVKSAKEKLFDEIEESIAVVNNSQVLDDWVSVLAEFEKVNRLLLKASQQSLKTPPIYIQCLSDLDQALSKASTEEKDKDIVKKKKNASVSKAFNTLKQRVKKVVREHSASIESYRASPDTFAKDQAALATQSEQTQPTSKTQRSQNSAAIFKSLRSVSESRGKKNVDVFEQIKTLESLIESTSSVYEHIVIYLMMIPLRFDSASYSSTRSPEQWNAAASNINSLFDILEKNSSSYRVLESAEPSDDIEHEPAPNANGVREILGSVASLVERLDDEFTHSLQIIDPYTTEYIDRLRDEQAVYDTIVRAQLYSELVLPPASLSNIEEGSSKKEPFSVSSGREQIARVISRRVEHIYFKSKKLISTVEASTEKNLSFLSQESKILPYSESENYPDKLMDALASILYQQSNAIYRKRAMLSHIYYYAHNNQYQKARNMFLVSHLQSSIHTSEPGLQILFNRALVQLGLCAFRNGMIQDSYQALQEIAASPRQKELLGQAGTRFYNQSTVVDKQRLLPFHTHINLELLECAILTSSLLIEIPQYAQLGSKKKLQNRSFRRFLGNHERQTFQGPPENNRDYIMHAAKALQAGNWKKSVELLHSIKAWNQFPESEQIRASIKEKIQVEGLRTYLFQFKSFYSKLSIEKLAQMFELSTRQVSAVVTKMIFNEEIAAGLDQVSNSIIFTQGVELTKLQDLSLSLADRASTLADRASTLYKNK